MSKSTISSVFPDINVWLALSSPDHEHFQPAWNWYSALPAGVELLFCRHTQMGLLRLLTTRAAMGAGTLSQAEAWQTYDRWLDSGGADFVAEPAGIEHRFRASTNTPQASPKDWADAYLVAFSLTIGSQLVTFDRALAGKAKGAILLR
jgi:toxin-antitoxin system PIN domain toxin